MPARRFSHAGFIASIDPSMARRQLRLSTGMVLALGIAIALTLFAVRPDPVSAGYNREGNATAGSMMRFVLTPGRTAPVSGV